MQSSKGSGGSNNNSAALMKAQLKVKTLEKVLKERTRILTEMEEEIVRVVEKLRIEKNEAEEALKRNKITKNVV